MLRRPGDSVRLLHGRQDDDRGRSRGRDLRRYDFGYRWLWSCRPDSLLAYCARRQRRSARTSPRARIRQVEAYSCISHAYHAWTLIMDQCDRSVVCFVCTGNAARSVMAVTMLRALAPDLIVRGAGTHVVEGQPMGVRTRTALARHGLADLHHRSRQFSTEDAKSDLIVVMEPAHILWIRSRFPTAAAVTGSLRRLTRDLPWPLDPVRSQTLAERVAILNLASILPESWEEVSDPGAGKQVDFDRCADELISLVTLLNDRLSVGR